MPPDVEITRTFTIAGDRIGLLLSVFAIWLLLWAGFLAKRWISPTRLIALSPVEAVLRAVGWALLAGAGFAVGSGWSMLLSVGALVVQFGAFFTPERRRRAKA